MAETIKIGGELESVATGGIVAAASAIKDKTKNRTQEQVNAETDETLAAHSSAISGFEGGNFLTLVATNADADIAAVFTRLSVTPAVNTIYRIANWKYNATTKYNTAYYSEYAANGTTIADLVPISVENKGIDDVPTAESENLIKSGGVQNELALGAVYDVSAKNPTAGPNSDGKFTLEYILDQNNVNTLIPTAVRKGGMSIKFVQSSDNKYVQFRLMSDTFNTTVANWQGVDDEPTAGSNNLVKSGGVANAIQSIANKTKNIEPEVVEDSQSAITIKSSNNNEIVVIGDEGITKMIMKGSGDSFDAVATLEAQEESISQLGEDLDDVNANLDNKLDAETIPDSTVEEAIEIKVGGVVIGYISANNTWFNGLHTSLPNNQWNGKKIGILGTSVTFGSESSYDTNPLDPAKKGHAYLLEASKKLNFETVAAGVPGLAIQAYKIVYRDDSNVEHTIWAPLSYGSSCLSKAEYAEWATVKPLISDNTYTIVSCSDPQYSDYQSQSEWVSARTGSGYTTWPDAPITWVPDGSYNNYYRTWENIFSQDNADVDLWLFATIPNNRDFDNTDWDAFNKNAFQYSDSSDFAEHRSTFIGAMLFLMKKMYDLSVYSRFAFVIDSGDYMTLGKPDLQSISNQYSIPIIDLYNKMCLTPAGLSVFKAHGGTDIHPSGYAQMLMGNILTNELLLIS